MMFHFSVNGFLSRFNGKKNSLKMSWITGLKIGNKKSLFNTGSLVSGCLK